MRKEVWAMIAIAVVIVVVGFFMAKSSNPVEPGQTVDNSKLLRSTSHSTGDLKAKVTLVEFGDYQCPACAITQSTVEELLAKYKGNKDFNFVFRNYPLPQHQNALISAEAAEAAAAQGKFWEMNDKIYTNQNEWAEQADPSAIFTKYATELGLDVTKFQNEVLNKKYADVISADQSDGTSLNLQGTPTFFLNGEMLPGIPKLEGFIKAIDEALKK